MRTLFLSILLTQSYFMSFAQTANVANDMDVNAIRSQIFNRIPKCYKTEKYQNMIYYFTANVSTEMQENLCSPNLYYTDWPELDDYLYKVFKLIAPAELSDKNFFKIIVNKDASFNANMYAAGLLGINVGLLDNLPDESTLAGIMAHELSHYLLQHSLLTYISYREGNFDNLFGVSESVLNKYSSKLEYSADSLATVLIHNSPYPLKSLIRSFDFAAMIDAHRNASLSKDFVFEMNGHPSNEDRKSRLIALCSKYDLNKGSEFVVGKELFFKIRHKAKEEILKILIDGFRYDEAIEKSFKYHLLEPSNLFYIKCLVESIRRNCYGNIDRWNKNFITYKYYGIQPNGKRTAMTNSLFEHFDPTLLAMSQEEVDSMKARFYWDPPARFSTFEQAFNYFVKAGKLLKEPETALSNALSYTGDTVSRKEQLKKYLQFNHVKYPEYAYYLLHDSLETVLPPRRLIVLDNVDAKIRLRKYDVALSSGSIDTASLPHQLLDSLLIGQDNTYGLYLPDLKRSDPEKYAMLSLLLQYSHWPMYSSGEPVYLHILEPQYWYLFKELNINRLEFVHCSFFGNDSDNNDPKQYWDLASKPIPEFINRINCSTYIDLSFSQISINVAHQLRSNFFKDNIRLNNKVNSFAQIISDLRAYRVKFYDYTEEREYRIKKW